jgi:LysR family hydrogen peroxide-inducible transcriptional activator
MDDRLQKFAALVEAGSFTKAAAALHLSQPALSVAISKLERSLKTTLLSSSGRHGIELTEAGKAVYSSALEHRAIEHNMQLHMASLSDDKIVLRIGLIDSVAALLCSQEEPLRTLEEQTELTLYIANSANLRAAVQSDTLDLAVVVANDAEDARLQTAAVGVDQLALVCQAAATERFQEMLSSKQQLPFISYVQTSATQRIIAAALERDHIAVDPILYSTSPDVMLQMVRRGRGVTLLPENLVASQIASGELSHLKVAGKPYRVERRLNVVALKGRHLPPRLAGLAWSVRQQLKAYAID